MSDKIADFKLALGNYPTGVTVVTACNDKNEPIGLTVNSFASVSIDPLLILWSLDKKSQLHPYFTATQKFAVNILASNQEHLCTLFSSKIPDRFAQVKWSTSIHDLPILHDTAAILQCKTFQQIDAGDHTVFIGQVLEIDATQIEPLLYHRRHIGQIPKSFYE
ncbi:flavin reductase family protein [Lysinibacillus pakistanensis]|uniref:Flavin reductase family protein n=1 Tax=Lysinibacillus pakistanensis TaxID=759811 RepID=A0AAX3X0B3_9BACI|nr:flavin reductase family protein [Lysinibacillus pakistanensis]MDM5232955.1 flavin reductase family protein [Lysinibacillus pakistanensis]WHY48447.1 flavin reductase family protein [Lysinibacillus pakistanensis]WHY53460.1 flavin reductase family protein [Lysinibacillus pakistanensis]